MQQLTQPSLPCLIQHPSNNLQPKMELLRSIKVRAMGSKHWIRAKHKSIQGNQIINQSRSNLQMDNKHNLKPQLSPRFPVSFQRSFKSSPRLTYRFSWNKSLTIWRTRTPRTSWNSSSFIWMVYWLNMSSLIWSRIILCLIRRIFWSISKIC